MISLELPDSEAEWLRKFLVSSSLGTKPMPSVSIHCDSQSTIAIAKNTSYNGNNRHVRPRHNVVKQL